MTTQKCVERASLWKKVASKVRHFEKKLRPKCVTQKKCVKNASLRGERPLENKTKKCVNFYDHAKVRRKCITLKKKCVQSASLGKTCVQKRTVFWQATHFWRTLFVTNWLKSVRQLFVRHWGGKKNLHNWGKIGITNLKISELLPSPVGPYPKEILPSVFTRVISAKLSLCLKVKPNKESTMDALETRC